MLDAWTRRMARPSPSALVRLSSRLGWVGSLGSLSDTNRDGEPAKDRARERWPGRVGRRKLALARPRARGCARWSSLSCCRLLSLLFLSQNSTRLRCIFLSGDRTTALARHAVELLLSTSCRTGRRPAPPPSSRIQHMSASNANLSQSTTLTTIGWISLLAFSAALMLMVN